MAVDFLNVVISRREVDSGDISNVLSVLRRLIESPKLAQQFFERVEIAFSGYDQVTDEVFEIPAVREFVNQLDYEFPYWLFFLSKHHLGLQSLVKCKLPPFLTDEARATVFPQRINELLSRRWFPAMNLICEYVRFSGDQIDELTDRVTTYFIDAKLLLA